MEHEQGHVTKHTQQEHELRDKLTDNIDALLKILAVDEGDEDSEEHVNNAEDDGDLHLEGVEEHNLVDRDLPDGIYAERIGCPVVSTHVSFMSWSVTKRRIDHYNLLMEDILEGHCHLPGGTKQTHIDYD